MKPTTRVRFLHVLGGASVLVGGIRCAVQQDLDMELVIDTPVAVGATVAARARDACEQGTGKLERSDPSCTTQSTIRLDNVTVDDRSVFEVADSANGLQQSSVSLRALKAGKATVRARADNGQSLANLDTAIRAERTTGVRLSAPMLCATPVLYGAGAKFTVNAVRYSGSERLYGSGGPFPVTSDIATKDADETGDPVFVARGTRGLGAIRSALDGDVSLPVEIFELADVTRMELSRPKENARVGGYLFLDVATWVGARPTCVESFAKDVRSQTPSVCAVEVSTGPSRVSLRALAVGTCTVSVTMGTNTATESYVISEAPPPPAFDAGDAGGRDGEAADAASDAKDASAD